MHVRLPVHSAAGTMVAMDLSVADLCKTTSTELIGRRLRAARKEAGLTLEAVAASIVSVSYLSRLEGGKRRADARVLTALAARLDVAVEDLVRSDDTDDETSVSSALRLEIDYAELSLAAGDIAGAASKVVALLENPSVTNATSALRHVRRLHAGVLEAQADLRGAIQVLEILAEDGPQDLLWLKDLISLSRCRRDVGDLHAAISAADDAAALIEQAGLAGTTEAIQLALTSAAALAEMGDVGKALELCRAEIDKAEAIGSSRALASAYWNASVYESRQGNQAAALPLARRALREFEQGDDRRNLGRLRTVVGQLMLKTASPDLGAAIAVLRQARRELDWSSAGAMELARNDLALARALFRVGEEAEAQSHLDASLEVLQASSPSLYAHALVLDGQVAFARQDRQRAMDRYRAAAYTLTGLGNDRTVGELWYELAALFETIGDHDGALAAYRSAAASAGFSVRPFEAAVNAAASNAQAL